MGLKLSNNYLRNVRDLPGISRLSGLGRNSDYPYTFKSFPAPRQLGGHALRALLTTALAGTNNDVTLTAVTPGSAGNSIRFRIVVAGASTAASVAVSGNDVTFNSATNGSSAATSTAAQMLTALGADTATSRLLTGVNAVGNDGTGVIAALAYTNLAGGVDYVIGN